MKTLTEYLNESKKSGIVDECNAKGSAKFGYMMYDDNSATVTVIEFDDLKEFAESQGFDVEDYMEIDKLEIGESAYDGASVVYTRIW
jgi:hypothetical protein